MFRHSNLEYNKLTRHFADSRQHYTVVQEKVDRATLEQPIGIWTRYTN